MSNPALTIATYNQMFAFDGTSCYQNIISHFFLHGIGNFKAAVKRSDLNRTLSFIQNLNADILGIGEILGPEQEAALRKFLQAQGYVSIFSGAGHQFKRQNVAVKNLIATKMPSFARQVPEIPLPKHMGFGGGFTWVFLPTLDLNVLNVHFALPFGQMRRAFEAQKRNVRNIIAEKFTTKRSLIMGDFNCSYREVIRELPELADFDRLSPDCPTCSLTPLFRWLFSKDVDHIFGKGLSFLEHGVMTGYSDHALLWAKVRVD